MVEKIPFSDKIVETPFNNSSKDKEEVNRALFLALSSVSKSSV